jgi:hypothetical protein
MAKSETNQRSLLRAMARCTIYGLEEVGDETVDGKATTEGLAKNLEATDCLGKGKESSSEAHRD